MRLHVIDYTKKNYSELAEELASQLRVRRISLQNYLELMEWTHTASSEITLLIIARIFKITIMVIRGDFIWVSENLEPKNFNVVIVQNCNGHFLGTKRLDGKLVNIGDVPKFNVNKRKSPRALKTSTPKEGAMVGDTSNVNAPNVSPILDNRKLGVSTDSCFSFDETLDDIKKLKTEVKDETNRIVNESTANATVMNEEKPGEKQPYKTLNIRDIGNDSTTETSTDESIQNVVEFPTPTSKSTVNITSHDGGSDIDINLRDSAKEIIDGIGVENNKTLQDCKDYNGDDEKTETVTEVSTGAMLNRMELTDAHKSPTNHTKCEESSDSDNTVDLDEDEEKSEIVDDPSSTSDTDSEITEDGNVGSPKKSEISDTKTKVQKKRLGLTGPVVKLNTMNVGREGRSAYERNNDTDTKVKYRDFSVVKLGCHKCTDIYYSEGAFNKHLIDKHRIRNTGHHPPIVINKILSKIPEKPPLLDGQKECRICTARFFDAVNFYNHESKCRKRTVEEEEDNQCSLY